MSVSIDALMRWLAVLKAATKMGETRVVFYHPDPTHDKPQAEYQAVIFDYLEGVGWQCPDLDLVITIP